jgi:hypothetical protein
MATVNGENIWAIDILTNFSNESRLHFEHIQLQAKLLAHKIKENGTMAEKLENTVI